MRDSYQDIYDSWTANPEGFWGAAAEDIHWFKAPESVFDPSQGAYGRWFAGGETNTCYNCIDRHIQVGRGAPGDHADRRRRSEIHPGFERELGRPHDPIGRGLHRDIRTGRVERKVMLGREWRFAGGNQRWQERQ